jgi:hypothetical protein
MMIGGAWQSIISNALLLTTCFLYFIKIVVNHPDNLEHQLKNEKA